MMCYPLRVSETRLPTERSPGASLKPWQRSCAWWNLTSARKTETWSALRLWVAFPPYPAMKDLLVLLAHLLTTVARLLGPGGTRAVVVDSLLIKQQFLVIHRSQRRAPFFLLIDRILLGCFSPFLTSRHIQRASISSFRGAADRDHSPRVPRPYPPLERGRHGEKADGVPCLLQRMSHPQLARWQYAS